VGHVVTVGEMGNLRRGLDGEQEIKVKMLAHKIK